MERQNRTIKTALLKVLQDHVKEWPNVIDGVLFAIRSTKQRSTGFSPFVMLYNRQPVLPLDVNRVFPALSEEAEPVLQVVDPSLELEEPEDDLHKNPEFQMHLKCALKVNSI